MNQYSAEKNMYNLYEFKTTVAGLLNDKASVSRDIIEKYVDIITRNIRDYKSKEDLEILKNLTDLCLERKLPSEMAKMHRNMAMCYSFRNNIEEAVKMMETVIREFRQQKNAALLHTCYSDLGLIYFYDHEYIKARELYEKVEDFLSSGSVMENWALHMHYYRMGLLYSNLREFEMANHYLEKALEYAETDSEKGLTVMNIGITYKRDNSYEKAREYYYKALAIFDEADYINRSKIYNNLASLYIPLGQLDTALKFINTAFEYLDNRDTVQLFIYFVTYTEINALMGEAEKSIDKFIDMLSHIEDFPVYKSYITENINSLAIAVDENMEMLRKLEAVVMKLIVNTAKNNTEYRDELEKCLENIWLCMRDADKSNKKGGIYFEKENC